MYMDNIILLQEDIKNYTLTKDHETGMLLHRLLQQVLTLYMELKHLKDGVQSC